MSRITQRFAKLKADKRAGLVIYISAGDPNAEELPAEQGCGSSVP